MDLTGALTDLAREVADAPHPVVALGGRTQLEVGDPVRGVTTAVTAPAGVVRFEPADLTVTVGAGTTVAALDAALAEAGQEVPLDPVAPHATVGGVLSVGTSGHRRLRYGPIRNAVLEVRFVTGDGRLVKGGGPTVKNVSGYDLPRLLVGSFGTLGVLGQVTLRARARPRTTRWATGPSDPDVVRRSLTQPSCVAWSGGPVQVLLEGHPADVEAEMDRASLTPLDDAPHWPTGPHRGRISVEPRRATALASALDAAGLRWLAEVGVGTVHVAADAPEALAAARAIAHAAGGWMLREAGAPELEGFGVPLPNRDLVRRIKDAFDPDSRLAPGRLPLDDRIPSGGAVPA